MFSIIIPLFNKEQTIARAVDSVLSQCEPEDEIVVVDDGSSDGGPAVVSGYSDSRIRLIRHGHGGVSSARNEGIRQAAQPYICFLDADDEYTDGYLVSLRQLISRFPASGVWAFRYYCESNGVLTPAVIRGLPEDFEGVVEDYFTLALSSDPPICTGNACIRREILLAIGGFPRGVYSGEDMLTWARVCVRSEFVYSMRIQMIYHQGGVAGFKPTRVPALDDEVGRQLAFLYREAKRPGIRQYVGRWHKNRASCFLRLGMRMRALKEVMKALYWSPTSWKLYVYAGLVLMPEKILRRVFSRLA